eukprot:TRINITY_DN20687_c0_g1_i2.p1 TRINITY_DN20687_c0_g1~~TRINITY_DN20687_c0_g1_i2.p1  ORF type:complete len:370 (-),score=65.91 TRINITY_DN20687_c0_g1_i2:151-1260(-)
MAAAVRRIVFQLVFFTALALANDICRRIARRLNARHVVQQAQWIATLVLSWYSLSITLTLFNKYILSMWNGGLKMPIFYTMSHMFNKGVFALLYITFMREGPRPEVSWQCLLAVSLIGIATGLDVVASNMSFMYISVSFYVMMKAGTILMILLLGVLMQIEPLSVRNVLVAAVVAVGIFFSSRGEAGEFNLPGFVLVVASEFFCAVRWVGSQKVMQAWSVDPVSTILYMSPGATLPLALLAIVRESHELVILRQPGVALQYVGIVFFSASFTFLLLLVELQLVKDSSSLVLSLFGNLKNVVTVLFAKDDPDADGFLAVPTKEKELELQLVGSASACNAGRLGSEQKDATAKAATELAETRPLQVPEQPP